MTRILKFRAYTEVRHEVLGMLYDVPHDFNNTVMQFTGLLDRNGKEVYEGDILAYANPLSPKNGKVKGHIVWDNCSYRLKRFRGTETQLDKLTAPSYMNSHIVVGNIYETPNLLK